MTSIFGHPGHLGHNHSPSRTDTWPYQSRCPQRSASSNSLSLLMGCWFSVSFLISPAQWHCYHNALGSQFVTPRSGLFWSRRSAPPTMYLAEWLQIFYLSPLRLHLWKIVFPETLTADSPVMVSCCVGLPLFWVSFYRILPFYYPCPWRRFTLAFHLYIALFLAELSSTSGVRGSWVSISNDPWPLVW